MFGKGALTTTTSHICAFIKSDDSLERSNLQIAMRPYSMHIEPDGSIEIDDFPAMTVSAIQTRPYSRGEVKIRSANPLERAEVNMNYLRDDRDVEILSEGMKKIRQMMAVEGISELVEQEVEPGAGETTPQALDQYLRNTSSTVYHPAGTCRMGIDELAVVDPNLKVKGVNKLRVVDCSIMPTITSGNTNAPAIMIGEKASDLILNDALDGSKVRNSKIAEVELIGG